MSTRAHVRVPIATLWTDPAAVRPVDASALADAPDIPAWIAAQTLEQRTTGAGNPVSTQLLAGEEVEIDAVDGEWATVVALGQPSRHDPRGYPGAVRTAHLRLGPNPAGPAAGPRAMDGPANGPVGGSASASVDGPTDRIRVGVAGTARRYAGLPYVWGGLSPHGLDCSALAHLSWRRHGVTIPRDADDQAAASRPLDFGAERPGDLYFFARPGRRIHHVGVVVAAPGRDGVRRMVHACGTTGVVRVEPIAGERLATLTGVHRVAGQPTGSRSR